MMIAVLNIMTVQCYVAHDDDATDDDVDAGVVDYYWVNEHDDADDGDDAHEHGYDADELDIKTD